MTIRIEIIDPTIKDEKMLVATARFLMELAGHQMVPAPKEETVASRFTKEIVDAAVKIDEDIAMEVIKENQEQPPAEIEKNKSKRKKKDSMTLEEAKKIQESYFSVGFPGADKSKSEVPVPTAPPFAHCGTPEPLAPPPPVETKIDFNSLIAKITKLTDEKKLENADVLRIVRTHGLDKTHYLSTNPHLIEAVNADIDKFVEGK
jgi:hypothetical protein